MNLNDLAQNFSDEDKARTFLEKMRWPDGVTCPHCGMIGQAYRLEPKPKGKTHVRKGVWKCGGCREQFTVTVGTIFEDSHIPLNKWLMAIHLLCASKKGMSAHQLHRMLGVTYKSAWFMAHRIRYAMAPDAATAPKLNGIVECDEVYIGGKPRYKGHNKSGRGTKKTPVFAAVQRQGEIRSRVVADVTGRTLKSAIKQVVDRRSTIMTDECPSYMGIGWQFDGGHRRVSHKRREYVAGTTHTNTVESSFALMKRGLNGIYHAVSKKHLHRYLWQFDFMWNNRYSNDGERTVAAIRSAEGKRLMYRPPVSSN